MLFNTLDHLSEELAKEIARKEKGKTSFEQPSHRGNIRVVFNFRGGIHKKFITFNKLSSFMFNSRSSLSVAKNEVDWNADALSGKITSVQIGVLRTQHDSESRRIARMARQELEYYEPLYTKRKSQDEPVDWLKKYPVITFRVKQ